MTTTTDQGKATMTATVTAPEATIDGHTFPVDPIGWPLEACTRCGGTGHYAFDGHDDICYQCRNIRPWMRVGKGTTPAEAQADYAKTLTRRAAGRARYAAKKEAERLARLAEREATWQALTPVFDAHPGSADATYYENLVAAGADPEQIRGYAYIADRWMQGWNITSRMCEIAAETTAKLIAATEIEPLVAGKQRITGVVKSLKWRDGYTRYSAPVAKIVIELPTGQRVWGTCPAAILDATQNVKGSTIALTATVSVSDDDPTFGFYSSPSKPELIEEAPTADAD